MNAVAQLSKHFSARDPAWGTPGWPAQSVKQALDKEVRIRGKKVLWTLKRLHFPSHTIKGRFWGSWSGMRSGTWWFWYAVRVAITALMHCVSRRRTMVVSWSSLLCFLREFLAAPWLGHYNSASQQIRIVHSGLPRLWLAFTIWPF